MRVNYYDVMPHSQSDDETQPEPNLWQHSAAGRGGALPRALRGAQGSTVCGGDLLSLAAAICGQSLAGDLFETERFREGYVRESRCDV